MKSEFVQRLLAQAPQFQDGYAKHLQENNELIPHVFMADVTRKVIANCSDRSQSLHLKALLVFFERELNSGDAEANDLIAAGFCENLIDESRALTTLLPLMGSALRQCMDRMK
jgi:hypothetical protein